MQNLFDTDKITAFDEQFAQPIPIQQAQTRSKIHGTALNVHAPLHNSASFHYSSLATRQP
jgi:hypothetical protein